MNTLNLYDRLKPEVLLLIEEEAKSYPYAMDSVVETLRSRYYLGELTLNFINLLVAVNGIPSIMGVVDYRDRYLMINLDKLFKQSTLTSL